MFMDQKPLITSTEGSLLSFLSYPGHGARFFGRDFALEDAIGSHACSLEALACV
jgi:hypothetical protein